MFERTTGKNEEAYTLLGQLKAATDAIQFRSIFNAFIAAARGITNSLQAEGKHIKGFSEWYTVKQQEMRTDELLRFIQEARIADFHEGKHRLIFPSAHIEFFSTEQTGPPPAPNASLVIGTEGPFWIVDRGTPRETRIPVGRGGKWAVQVAVDNAPSVHRGQQLTRKDPVTLCELALTYFRELVYEAKSNFSSAG